MIRWIGNGRAWIVIYGILLMLARKLILVFAGRQNWDELRSKDEENTIHNDQHTSTTQPHDHKHCRKTQRVVSCGTRRVYMW